MIIGTKDIAIIALECVTITNVYLLCDQVLRYNMLRYSVIYCIAYY